MYAHLMLLDVSIVPSYTSFDQEGDSEQRSAVGEILAK
jgi:hypothetical protein